MAKEATYTYQETEVGTVFDVTPCSASGGFLVAMTLWAAMGGLLCWVALSTPGNSQGFNTTVTLVAIALGAFYFLRLAGIPFDRRGQMVVVNGDGIRVDGEPRIEASTISGIYVLDFSGQPISAPAFTVGAIGSGMVGAPIAAGITGASGAFTAAHAVGQIAANSQAARDVKVVAQLENGKLVTLAKGLSPNAGAALMNDIADALEKHPRSPIVAAAAQSRFLVWA